MTDNNYILGRGEIRINGRYIGNSPSMMFMERPSDGAMRIKFATDNMSPENMALYFSAQRGELKEQRFVIDYKAFNPAGKNIDFHFGSVDLRAGEYEFKGENWQSVQFIGLLNLDSENMYYHMTERPPTQPVEEKPVDGSPLLEWAVDSWNKQVKNRPIQNVHRPSLDTVWRRVVTWAGGDPEKLLGLNHYKLAGEDWMPALKREKQAVVDIEVGLKRIAENVGLDLGEEGEKIAAALAVVKERYADIL